MEKGGEGFPAAVTGGDGFPAAVTLEKGGEEFSSGSGGDGWRRRCRGWLVTAVVFVGRATTQVNNADKKKSLSPAKAKLSLLIFPTWTTKKELYFLLRKGFLIDYEKWFSVSKYMKRRLMIPASTFLDPLDWECNSVPESESRFKVVTKSLRRHSFGIRLRFDSQLLSPQTTYSCHLIYKLSDYSAYEGPMVIGINDGDKSHLFPLSICLSTHCHPPVIGVKDDQKSAGLSDIYKMKGHPKQRKDGWMQVKFSEVSIPTMNTYYILSVEEKEFRNTSCFGIVIEGIEFRPV